MNKLVLMSGLLLAMSVSLADNTSQISSTAPAAASNNNGTPVVDLSQPATTNNNNTAPATAATTPATTATTAPSMAAPTVQTINPQSLSSDITTNSQQAMIPMEQRVGRIEQQLNNLTKMNMPQQIADLQQQIQQLSGQLQVQSHDLKLLNDQQRSFYQDLDQRINQLKNLSGGASSSSSSTSSSASNNNVDIKVKEANAYQNSFKLVTDKNYPAAITAFQGYLNDYPNGQFVANAHYWLGELFLLQKDSKKAAVQFQTVLSKFASSPKAIDAKLKLAMIHIQQGNDGLAKTALNDIIKNHKGTTAARLAGLQLQQMNAGNGKATTGK